MPLEVDLETGEEEPAPRPAARAGGGRPCGVFAIAVVLAFLLPAGGQVDTPPLVAITLVATSLGVVVRC